MAKTITDRKILRLIYDRYYQNFSAFNKTSNKNRETKIYVPIDCVKIAKELNVDTDIIFGRLYYHLNKKYGYTQEDNSKVLLFSPVIGKDRNAVHFPLLSAVLAELEESQLRLFTMPVILSILALIISLLSILFF
jgi:hypothetical protein